jgi:hypothetical protein
MLAALAVLLALGTPAASADRTVLAIGAHAGDAEITTGALLARHKRLGDRVALLHFTLGEGGNPKMRSAAYGEQKKREALVAVKVFGAEVLFGPWKDGQRDTGWPRRRHLRRSGRRTSSPTGGDLHGRRARIVNGVPRRSGFQSLPRQGVRGVYYADNWEDAEGFTPYLYVDVTEDLAAWRAAVTSYEFIRGGISSFPYLEYYEALARVRGAVAGRRFAVALEVDPFAKRQVLDALP